MASACWFRCDLRTLANPALSAARAEQAQLAIFVIAPDQWAAHDEAPAKQWLWREAVRDLGINLAKEGITLKLLCVKTWQTLPEQLLAFCQQHDISVLHCNREQGVHERNRDRQSYSVLQRHGIELRGHDGQTLLPPGSVKTGQGDFYRVFTPFSRAALAKISQIAATIETDAPLMREHTQAQAAAINELIQKHWPDISLEAAQIARLQTLWATTEMGALERLEQFIASRITHYHTLRDIPAVNGTSTLSPYLAAGMLSPQQCLLAARMANGGELESGQPGVKSWINELLWREFYRHLLVGYPRLSMHRPLREQTDRIRWRESAEDFTAWCQGRTGFPIVDAAMRQLLATGWMHNRLRMVVAMFLSKNLLIDWRRGEQFFMKNLIDGDLAANNGGWQWSASTGADAVPYFRVFNPLTQSKKFDPNGIFLRRWLPELANLDNRSIHQPNSAQRAQCHYPAEIVDLKESRLRAIATFEQLAGET